MKTIKHLLITSLTVVTFAIGAFAQADWVDRKVIAYQDLRIKIGESTTDTPYLIGQASFVCPVNGKVLVSVDATIRVKKKDGKNKNSEVWLTLAKDKAFNWSNYTAITELGNDGHKPADKFKHGVFIDSTSLTLRDECVATQPVTYYLLGVLIENATPLTEVYYATLTAHLSPNGLNIK